MRRLAAPAPLLVTVAVLAALWVTNAGSVAFFSGGPRIDPSDTDGPDQSQLGGKPSPPTPHPHHDAFAGLGLLNLMGYVTLSIFVLALLAFVVSATRNSRRDPPERLNEAADSRDAIDASMVPGALLETTEQQLRAIRAGSPRNAIVACWWELESSSKASGFPRGASETSSEFTQRVLARYSVEATAIETLAALYREARFSVHEMTEAERERAVVALEQILVGLRTARARTATAAAGP